MIFDRLPVGFQGLNIWGSISGKKKFVIVEDHGEFTASFRKFGGSTTTHIIDYDNRVKSFDIAKAACEEVNKNQ